MVLLARICGRCRWYETRFGSLSFSLTITYLHFIYNAVFRCNSPSHVSRSVIAGDFPMSAGGLPCSRRRFTKCAGEMVPASTCGTPI
jgi:hypothetical protein